MCFVVAVAWLVWLYWLSALLLLRGAVVVVWLGAVDTHGGTYMPYSPTEAVLLVAVVGCAVCCCCGVVVAVLEAKMRIFGPFLALLLLLRRCFGYRVMPNGCLGHIWV